MSLQALKIVRETLSREIERLHHRADRMVRFHAERVEYARFVLNGGFDSERAKRLGIEDGPGYDHMRNARRYLDSCGPALSEMDEPGCWITLPEADLAKHSEYGRTAARIQLMRDTLLARIEAECIEQPDPMKVEALAIVDGRRCGEDAKYFTTVGEARKFLAEEEEREAACADGTCGAAFPEASHGQALLDQAKAEMTLDARKVVLGTIRTEQSEHFSSVDEAQAFLDAELGRT